MPLSRRAHKSQIAKEPADLYHRQQVLGEEEESRTRRGRELTRSTQKGSFCSATLTSLKKKVLFWEAGREVTHRHLTPYPHQKQVRKNIFLGEM